MSGDSRQWFLLALLVGLGWLIYKLAPVITPFVISAALAYMGDPLVDRLQRLKVYRWPVARTAAVVIVFLLMTAAVGLLGLGPADLDLQSLTEAARGYWKEVSSAAFSVLGTMSRGGQAVLHWLMNLVLIPVVTFYLLRDWDRLVQAIQNLIPRQDEPVVSELFREIDDVLGAFIRGQLMVMLALGLVYTLGLW